MDIEEIRILEVGGKTMRRLQVLAECCYMPAYAKIHTEEQNRYSFEEMYSDESLMWQTKEQHSRYFIISEDGEDIGYSAIYPMSENEWMLDKLYVKPESKGKGFGGKLMEHVMGVIEDETGGNYRVTLNVNRRNDAVGFYQRYGFEITDKWDRTIADGRWVMDGWTMEKRQTKAASTGHKN